MTIFQAAAWSVIAGLSLMLVGGLVLWAYSTRPSTTIAAGGLEAEATHRFHRRLTRWFFVYGVLVIAAGAALLFWGGSIFL